MTAEQSVVVDRRRTLFCRFRGSGVVVWCLCLFSRHQCSREQGALSFYSETTGKGTQKDSFSLLYILPSPLNKTLRLRVFYLIFCWYRSSLKNKTKNAFGVYCEPAETPGSVHGFRRASGQSANDLYLRSSGGYLQLDQTDADFPSAAQQLTHHIRLLSQSRLVSYQKMDLN